MFVYGAVIFNHARLTYSPRTNATTAAIVYDFRDGKTATVSREFSEWRQPHGDLFIKYDGQFPKKHF